MNISGKLKILAAFLLVFMSVEVRAQVDPWVMVKKMGRGTNIGNTMDAPYEGRWGNEPIQEYYFDDYKDAGYTCVRIPIRWDNHMLKEAPFAIDSTWLDRVEQVVNWSLQRHLVTIINSHHDDWLYENFPEHLPRFEALWRQVAERFRNKSDDLLFEIINEPYFDLSEVQVDTLNRVILKIIRQTNPHRIVILTGGGQNSYLAVTHIHPPDDPYLMAYFHYYLPRSFTHDKIGTWGNAQDKLTMDSHFDLVKSWSDQHGLPILLGEFGVSVGADRPSLLRWYGYAADGAIRRGFAFTVWDAGPNSNKFVYYRQPGTWDEELLNVLMDQRPFGGNPWPVPGVIQAEDFDRGGPRVAYSDSDSLNSFGFYRPDEGVEIDSLTGGGYAVQLDQPREWTEYTFQADTSGDYRLFVRAAASSLKNGFYLRFNGLRKIGPFSGFSDNLKNFAVVSDSIFVGRGVHVVRACSETGGVRLDWMRFERETNMPENLLANGGFELGLVNWQVKQCTATVVDSPAHSGQHALLLTDRTKPWSGVFQNVKEKLLKFGPGFYLASGYFRAVSDTGIIGKVKVRLDYGGAQHHIGTLGKMDTTDWTLVSDTLYLNWNTPLGDANLFIQTAQGITQDFWVDDVSLTFLGSETRVAEKSDTRSLPRNFALTNFPNPFNPQTTISFRMARAEWVELTIFNLQGQQIRKLMKKRLAAGTHRVLWNGRDDGNHAATSGCYFAVLRTKSARQVHKMILLR